MRCDACGGEGWLWGWELLNASEDTYNDTMTQYTCDRCDGKGEIMTTNQYRANGAIQEIPAEPARVLGFGLWFGAGRKDKAYLNGAFVNLELARVIYPEWQCWYYCHKGTVEWSLANELKDAGAKIVWYDDENPWLGLFWRFDPAAYSWVQYYKACDLDSSLNWRERAAIDCWIRSGKTWLNMKDHPQHSCAMVGDMWGCKGGAIPDLDAQIKQWADDHVVGFGGDQAFLQRRIWPRIDKQDMMQFDSQRTLPRVKNNAFGQTCYFPSHDWNGDCRFVGQTYVGDKHITRRSRGGPQDEYAIHAALAKESHGNIVELGVLNGKISGILLANAPDDAKVWGFDPMIPDSMNPKIVADPAKIMVLASKYPEWHFCRAYSWDAIEAWPEKPISYLFIDADHRYKKVKLDFEEWGQHVVHGGYLSLHDSACDRGGPHNWPGPSRLAIEIMANDKWEYVDTVYSLTVFRRVR